jgi:uncharacterized protein (DUF169 family)
MKDYAELSKKMMYILGLKKEPVAIKLIKKGESLPEGYKVSETPLRHCQSVMKARDGEMICLPAEKNACPVGSSALGEGPLPEKVRAGEFHHNMGMYDTPEAAAKTMAVRPQLPPGTVIATAVAPLSKTKVDPDVIVVTGQPEQMFWLVPAATTFTEGGRVTVEMAAVQAACADSTVVPYITGNINISLGCLGCRKTSSIGPDEMIVGIPAKKLEALVAALEKMGAKAIPNARAKV